MKLENAMIFGLAVVAVFAMTILVLSIWEEKKHNVRTIVKRQQEIADLHEQLIKAKKHSDENYIIKLAKDGSTIDVRVADDDHRHISSGMAKEYLKIVGVKIVGNKCVIIWQDDNGKIIESSGTPIHKE